MAAMLNEFTPMPANVANYLNILGCPAKCNIQLLRSVYFKMYGIDKNIQFTESIYDIIR